MTGDLNTYIAVEKRELGYRVRQEAKKLRLRTLIEEIETIENARSVANDSHPNFQRGEVIMLDLTFYLRVGLEEHRLTIMSSRNDEIGILKTFRGSQVRGLYNRFSETVIKEAERLAEDLPF